MSHIVLNGDNIEVLKKYPDNYFDAVVTDPPYGLGKEPNAEDVMKGWIEKGYHEVGGSGFMGKEWDAFVPQPIFWKEVFRVLKHGGHVLAFYGTRTYDWGVMAMRFAGFEVRDTIYWHYGSGFPKSHNISKAIDKMGGESLDWFIDYILDVAKDRNISKKELTMLFPSKNGNPTGWLWNKQNNQSITTEQFNTIKNFLQLPFSDINEAKGEIVGRGKAGLTKGNIANFSGDVEFDIIAPESENAKQWDGWGSALKPASEPIVMARKPLEKGLSIAENVLKWGTGGINIDRCRVIIDSNDPNHRETKPSKSADTSMFNIGGINYGQNDKGRFPANLIMTHHPDCECNGLKKVKGVSSRTERENRSPFESGNSNLVKSNLISDENGEETIEHWECHPDCPIKIMDEQSGESRSGKNIEEKGHGGIWNKSSGLPVGNQYGDTGGSSRFFYCAKASKSERNKGLEGFEEKVSKKMDGGKFDSASTEATNRVSSNFHPTVKPIKLMQYLVRLVTPPNGVVLDPFCGSGTTGIACKLEGFEFVGIEQDQEYTKIAEARIENYQEEPLEPLELIKEDSKGNTITQKSLF